MFGHFLIKQTQFENTAGSIGRIYVKISAILNKHSRFTVQVAQNVPITVFENYGLESFFFESSVVYSA